MNNEQTKKDNEAKGEKRINKCQKQTNEITRTYKTKTKYGGSCIHSNRFVSLIKDIVASIIILLAVTFINGDPYRSSVHMDFES